MVCDCIFSLLFFLNKSRTSSIFTHRIKKKKIIQLKEKHYKNGVPAAHTISGRSLRNYNRQLYASHHVSTLSTDSTHMPVYDVLRFSFWPHPSHFFLPILPQQKKK